MLSEIFYWVFNMSVTAVATGLVVLMIRMIPRIPKRATVYLWMVPFFRMIVPIGMSSRYSLMTLISRISTRDIIVNVPIEDFAPTQMNIIQAAQSYRPVTYKTDLLSRVFDVSSVVWIIGAVAVLSVVELSYISAMRDVRRGVHLRDNIYLCDRVESIAVYGIIRPKIVVPSSFGDIPDIILEHERTHIRRRDNLRRLIAIVITAFHWFNPLAWVFLGRYLADLEFACDESVLSRSQGIDAREYASALLDRAEKRRVMSVASCAFGAASTKKRIEKVLSFRKMTVTALAATVAIVAASCFVLLTNAA